MKFEVGQKWKNGKEEVVVIIEVQDGDFTTYPVIGDNGAIYTSEGTYWSDRGSNDDLVELVDEPEDIDEPKEADVAEQEANEPKEADVAEQEADEPKNYVELVGKVEEQRYNRYWAEVDTQKLEAEFNEYIKEMKDIVGRLMYDAATQGDVTCIANLTIKLTALNKLGK